MYLAQTPSVAHGFVQVASNKISPTSGLNIPQIHPPSIFTWPSDTGSRPRHKIPVSPEPARHSAKRDCRNDRVEARHTRIHLHHPHIFTPLQPPRGSMRFLFHSFFPPCLARETSGAATKREFPRDRINRGQSSLEFLDPETANVNQSRASAAADTVPFPGIQAKKYGEYETRDYLSHRA